MSDDDRDELNDHWHEGGSWPPGWWIFPGVVLSIVCLLIGVLFFPRITAAYIVGGVVAGAGTAIVCGIILLIAKRN